MPLRVFFFLIVLENVNGNAVHITLSQTYEYVLHFCDFKFVNRRLSVVFNLEARCVVKKIQDYFLLLGSGIILVSPFRLIYICS